METLLQRAEQGQTHWNEVASRLVTMQKITGVSALTIAVGFTTLALKFKVPSLTTVSAFNALVSSVAAYLAIDWMERADSARRRALIYSNVINASSTNDDVVSLSRICAGVDILSNRPDPVVEANLLESLQS